MSVRILCDDGYCALYCSTTMTAFGPIIYGDHDDAEAFLATLPVDARLIEDSDLAAKYADWMKKREEEK